MKDFIRNKVRENLIFETRIQKEISVPDNIVTIKNVFSKNGFKLFLVGGAVRDSLLGKEPKDYDIATDAVPDEVERIMAKAGIKTLPTGKENGVISAFLPVNGELEEYEIATFRKDIGTGRRPDSVEFTTIDQDVKRRDLTINALFYDMETKEIVDLVGGIEDLENGIVRAVGDPTERFNDDRLRIQRAIRFQATMGGEMDKKTEQALLNDASLEGISGERIRDEFLKGIKKAKSVKHFLELNAKFGLFDWIFRGLSVDKDFIEDRDPMVVIATLLKSNDITKLPKGLNNLKYSADENKIITFLIALLEFKEVGPADVGIIGVELKKMMNKTKVSSDQIRNFGGRAGIMSQILDALEEFQFSVSGQEVQDETGLKPSKELGDEIKRREVENFDRLLGGDA